MRVPVPPEYDVLRLYTASTKNIQNPLTKSIDWKTTGYGKLSVLVFNTLGTKLVAVSDKLLYVLPFAEYMKHNSIVVSGQRDHVVGIKLPSFVSGRITYGVWWQTALNKNVIIIGTEKGHLMFMDIDDKKCLYRSQVNGHITKLEIVPDDRRHITYLLISGRSSLQWRLLLDIMDLDMYMTSSNDKMAALGYLFYGGKTYLKSILHPRSSSAEDSEFIPRRFTNIPISVTLSYQNAKGCHLVGAIDKTDNSLKIYDSTMERNPLFIYSLPFWTEHIAYTDRLIFVALSGQHVLAIANQLSEQDSSSDTQASHLVFKHELDTEERVQYITSIKFSQMWYLDLVKASSSSHCPAESHSVIDGCLIITNQRLIQITPSLSPEQLFLDWSASETLDMERLEALARVTNIDILNLYLKSAEYHLSKGHAELALDYFLCSKCNELIKISMLHKYRQYSLVIELSGVLLLSDNTQISNSMRSEISDMVLEAYIFSSIHSKTDLGACLPFREFLLYNKHYSLDKATHLLCDHNVVSLLLELALSRKFICGALEHVFIGEKLNSKVLHRHIDNKEFISALETVVEGAVVYLLAPDDFCVYLLSTSNVRLSDLQWFACRLKDVRGDSLTSLSIRYHPYSNFVQTAIAKYKTTIETASAQSYAFLEQENEEVDSTTVTAEDFTSYLYLFYVKLMLELSSHSAHQCLLRSDLERLSLDMATAGDHKPEDCMHTLLCSAKRGGPICCSSSQVYSLNRKSLFTWGSQVKLDSLSIEDRVRVSTPIQMNTLQLSALEVKAISCGEKHLMVLCADGLYGRGSSQYGQVGAGAFEQYEDIVKVSLPADYVDIVCGRYHTLAVDKHGRVYSWGWALFGQLGHASISNECAPRLIDTLSGVFVRALAAGHSHSLALTVQGQVWVFGSNAFGQIDSTVTQPNKFTTPVILNINSPITLISTKYFHSVAVTETGEIFLWGIHPFMIKRKAQILKASGGNFPAAFRECQRINKGECTEGNVVQVASGWSHTLFLTDCGTVYIWEEDLQSKITTSGEAEDPAGGLRRVSVCEASIVYISCDNGYSVALATDGSLYTWGKNDYGQLGLSLRNIRYVEKAAQVKICKSYRVTSSSDMYKTRVRQCLRGADCDDSSDWDNEGPYSRDCDPLELAVLSRLESFPVHQSLCLAISVQIYPAIIALLFASHSWNEAWFYHLKYLLTCQSHVKDNYCIVIMDVMEFYLEKLSITHKGAELYEHVTQLTYRVLQFWHAKQLPVRPEFEQRLGSHLELVSLTLCQLLLTHSSQAKLPDSLVQAFSSSFLASVCRCGIKGLSQHNTSADKTATWRGVVNTMCGGLANRASTTLTHFDIERLKRDHNDSDCLPPCNVIIFSCGHHYTRHRFDSKILPDFERKILIKLPISGSVVIDRYRNGGYNGMACPQCVYGSIPALVS